MLGVDISPWLRPDAATSPDRLFCHVYGRGKGQAQMIPGWPYSVVAALEPGRSSWTALLDAVRLGPADDETEVTAGQVREVVTRLVAAGRWNDGDPDILVVFDAGYDVTRLAFLLGDLPVQPLGRLRSDRFCVSRSRPALPVPGAHPSTARSSTSPTRPAGRTPRSRPWPTPPATARPVPAPGSGYTRG
jgi:DDE superfamily endonuclease